MRKTHTFNFCEVKYRTLLTKSAERCIHFSKNTARFQADSDGAREHTGVCLQIRYRYLHQETRDGHECYFCMRFAAAVSGLRLPSLQRVR